jgi:hypothetical protein
LAAHDAFGHVALEVGLQEIGLFVLECLEASAMACGSPLDDRYVLCGDGLDRCLYLGDLLRGELEGPVERGDLDLEPGCVSRGRGL